MLLRQALEQTRAGMPAPVLFNSRIVVFDQIDEVSDMAQMENPDVRFPTVHNRAGTRSFLRGPAGQLGQAQPHRRAAGVVTGAQAS